MSLIEDMLKGNVVAGVAVAGAVLLAPDSATGRWPNLEARGEGSDQDRDGGLSGNPCRCW